jgi:group I intron endonuclease
MAHGIYKIINILNNKFYVGSAVDLKRRKTRHFSELRKGNHKNGHLQAAWKKYGEQAFIFVVVEEVADVALLFEKENVWLKEHVGKPYCYNIGTDAAAPMLGKTGEQSPTWGLKRTAEQLRAQSWEGRTHAEESKEKIRQFLVGKPKSAETRAKISATLMGEGNFWFGKKRPDHGAKVSKAVEVTDNEGRKEVFPSIAKLRETLDIKPPTVNRALKSGRPLLRGPLEGWSFKYVDPTPPQ